MIDWLVSLWINPYIAILCYWIPFFVCALGYFQRTYHNYRKDIENRQQYQNYLIAKSNLDNGVITEEDFRKTHPTRVWDYTPTDTYGTVIGRALMTTIPFANVIAAIFDVAPKLFKNFFTWIETVFNQPLVPDESDDFKFIQDYHSSRPSKGSS